jgi:hypothetical protein
MSRQRNVSLATATIGFVVITTLIACRGGGAPPVAISEPAAPPPSSDSGPTYVAMRNVDFHLGGDVVMHIRELHGVMRGRAGVVDFDNSRSFVTWITSATASLRNADLTNLFNNHVFAYPGAPLRHMKIEMRGGYVYQSGILMKGVPIPFKIKAEASLTPDGRIRLHPVDTDIFCVDGDKLMSALHLTMEKMVDVSGAHGITVEKNDFIIDPVAILPPPAIRARLLSVRVAEGELIQEIGPDPELRVASVPNVTPPDTQTPNWMYYRGGHLGFGRKLMMTDADMQVVDAAPETPFDFDLEHYMPQLTAGYSKTLPSAGLYVVMPDANHLVRLEQTVGGEVTSSRRDTAGCNCKP